MEQKIEYHFHDQSYNNPSATSVVNNYTIYSSECAGQLTRDKEMKNTLPLMKYIFDDAKREQFAYALSSCKSHPEVASLLRQLQAAHLLYEKDVKTKTFREAILPFLGYDTSENTLKIGLIAAL